MPGGAVGEAAFVVVVAGASSYGFVTGLSAAADSAPSPVGADARGAGTANGYTCTTGFGRGRAMGAGVAVRIDGTATTGAGVAAMLAVVNGCATGSGAGAGGANQVGEGIVVGAAVICNSATPRPGLRDAPPCTSECIKKSTPVPPIAMTNSDASTAFVDRAPGGKGMRASLGLDGVSGQSSGYEGKGGYEGRGAGHCPRLGIA